MSDATAKPPAPDEQRSKLRPANENPWYMLATLHGEQPEGAEPWDFDKELHAKNRLAWNRFMATIARPEALETARALKNADGSPRTLPEELKPFDEKELKKLKQQFRQRGGDEWPKVLIDFNDTAFTRAIIFNGFWFAENVSFDRATFSGNAGFSSATFSDTARFGSATFSGNAGFGSATFSGYTRFTSATFSGWSHFDNAKLQSLTSFAHAKFFKHPPRFHGASLHEGTQWHGATWPRARVDSDEAQQHVYNYERLKQEMERLKKHEDELNFFALEMRARRVVVGKWSAAGIINAAYEGLSAYGRSVARPVFGFAATLLLGAVPIALWMGGARIDWFWLPKFKNALWMSIANVLAPLSFRKDFFDTDMLAALPLWMKLLSGAQTLLGLLFLFLIGLALRNRFRMK